MGRFLNTVAVIQLLEYEMVKLGIVLQVLYSVQVYSEKSDTDTIQPAKKSQNPISSSNDQFSSQLYYLLSKMPDTENLVFSPVSISGVMAMMSVGARKRTLKQISDALFFPSSHTLLAGYKELIPALMSNRDFTLETANSLFVMEGYPISDDFQTSLSNNFHSSVNVVDFSKSKAAAKEINSWVEKTTRNKIKDLIEPSMVDADTALILVNALYFKSNWAKNFEKAEPKKFFISPSKSIKVPMMSKEDFVYFAQLASLSSSMVELPYKGNKVTMQVLLPDNKDGLEEVEEKLKTVNINDLFEKEKQQKDLDIQLPKFKLESTFELKEALTTLGVGDMFSESAADFSGITTVNKLFVSFIVQKAFIEVDEKGSEAAAASAVGFSFESATPPPEPFVADHPFIFFLRHKESGMLLFQGRVTNPLK